MRPSRTPTVNYQEHFGIHDSRRRVTTNPFDRNNVTQVPANISLSGDGPNDSDVLTGTEGLSEAEGEGEGGGEDESEGDDVIGDLENADVDVDEDIGLEEVATEGWFQY